MAKSVQFMVEFYSHSISVDKKPPPQLYDKQIQATKAAEKWVGQNTWRSADLKVFNAAGKLQRTLHYGPKQITQFNWSQHK